MMEQQQHIVPAVFGGPLLLRVGRGAVVASGGDAISINGVGVTDANFNDTTPAATAGRELLLWQRSGTGPDQVSVQTPPAVPIVLDREPTDLTVTNTTTETSIFSFAVPANAMGTNRMLLLQIWGTFLNNSGVAAALTWRVKFGGTTIFQDGGGSHASGVNIQPKNILVCIGNQGATNDQTGGGRIIDDFGTVPPTTGIAGDIAAAGYAGDAFVSADAALDTTLAQTIDITIVMSVANANTTFTRKYASLTLI